MGQRGRVSGLQSQEGIPVFDSVELHPVFRVSTWSCRAQGDGWCPPSPSGLELWKEKGLAFSSFRPAPVTCRPWRAGRTYGPASGKSSRESCQGGPDGAERRHRSTLRLRLPGGIAALRAHSTGLGGTSNALSRCPVSPQKPAGKDSDLQFTPSRLDFRPASN